MNRFDDRVVVITGAGKGLGRAYAKYLSTRGARLLLNNRRREVDAQGLSAVDHLVQELRAQGCDAVANHASVDDAASGRQMIEQALDTWGRIDVLINNAGFDRARSFGKFDLDAFLEIFEINFHGSLYVTHAAWNHMREAGYGRIIVSASSAGLHGGHGLAPYGAAKGALIALMRTLASEGRKHGILANAIAPYAATPMTGDHIPEPLQERLDPARVAPLVAYLASERNRDVTGQTFVAAGGRFARAATVEAEGLIYPADQLTDEAIERDIARLQDLSGAREFSDAGTAFREFVRPLVPAQEPLS